MSGWIDVLRSVLGGTLDLAKQGPSRLNNVFNGSPEQQKQYKQWFDTQMGAMGLAPLGDNPEILGDLGYSPSSAVVMNPKNAAKIFEKLEAYKALGNTPSQVAELYSRLKNRRLSEVAPLEHNLDIRGGAFDPTRNTITYNPAFSKYEEIPGILKHENIHAWQALKSNRLKEDPYLVSNTVIDYMRNFPDKFKELRNAFEKGTTSSGLMDLLNKIREEAVPIEYSGKKVLNYFNAFPKENSELMFRIAKNPKAMKALEEITRNLYMNQPIEQQAHRAQLTANKAFEKFQELTGFKF